MAVDASAARFDAGRFDGWAGADWAGLPMRMSTGGTGLLDASRACEKKPAPKGEPRGPGPGRMRFGSGFR